MERPRCFFTKRTEHYNNIQKEENKKKAIEQSLTIQQTKELDKSTVQSAASPKVENLDPNKTLGKTPSKERPLKCLETLAQKAGITFDEKYENSLSMEKSQSPAQQVAQAQQMPLTLLPEQFSQLQQFQIQQYATGQPTIQVKQEYATQQQPQGISAADLKTLQDHHQNQLHQMQIVQDSPQSPHQQNQAAQNALQQAVNAGQVPAEYLQQRVQVLQQPIQNASYLQQMYSPQLVMSAGSLLAHSGLGQQQQIQLIAGKPFQNQLTPQMLNSGGKPVLTQGAQGFSYTLPTIPSSQSQTLLFSPVAVNNVINSQAQSQQNNQQNMLPTVQTQNTPTKSDGQKTMAGQKVLQKVTQANAGNQQTATVASQNQQAANQQQQQQCVQISQTMPTAQILGGQTMQLTPWNMQSLSAPFWTTTGGLQPQTLVANAGQLIFRGTNPDGTQMLFQQSPTPTATQTVQSPHNQISLVGNIAQATATQNNAQKVRPNSDAMTPKTQNQQRAPPILPQGAAPIRPASSVSTQTNQMNQNATLLAKTPKVRTKQTPVRPAAPNIKVSINQQTGQPTMMQQVVTPAGANKMVLMSNINGQLTPVLQQSATQQILTNDKLKSQQQQAHQQVIIQQAMAAATQQQALQQQIAQYAQLQQQHQLLQNAQAQNAQLLQQGGIQQVVLQQQQMPTVTVTSSANLGQQTLPTHLTQQGIMTKAGTQQIFQMTQPVSSHSVSIATSMANSNPIITSIAGNVTADTSNAIIGPLTSPQTPLQPPQNPLIAMTNLSASPMPISIQKEKVDAASGGDSSKVSTSSASTITSSPLKRSIDQDNESKNDSKKQDTKNDENSKNIMSSPSVKNQQQNLSTPNSTTKAQANAANNSPLATQNGETDAKKVTTNGTSTSAPLLKNELPKAMVKPNVLTHVIEGYVIQESNEPFPVTRQRYSEKENDEPPKKKQAVEETKASSDSVKVNGESSSSVSSSTPIQSPNDMVACEQCGKQEMRSKLKRKKFCSVNCARLSKNSSIEGSPAVASNGGDERNSVNASPSLADKSKTDANESSSESPSIEEHVMMKWSVTQVCDFIKNLPGCSDYAEDFALQEIDGQALLLLKENHLVSAMGMKLGPALKIVNKIESMRVSKDGEQQGDESMDQQSSMSGQ